ncbi:3-deoxy-7-phosphoheptulonate synthase [Geodermatophilus sp. CPCC 205761]|uniref:3-deoxy-7-phosphoheptulonate synthase n=1 Tax=Geodermatophilus sp. CPCC 205761 TaxID=2936597 RepID=UPI003F52FCCE
MGSAVRTPGSAPPTGDPGAAAPARAPQQPDWPDLDAVAAARRELAARPALVGPRSVARLRARMAAAAQGRAMVVQGGDCAEAFGTDAETVRRTLGVLAGVATVLSRAGGVPVVEVGRIAGQYAKPRSSPIERVGDRTLPSFRGHIVHDHRPSAAARRPDPRRLVRAHDEAAATLRAVDAATAGRRSPVWTSHEALLLDYEEPLVRRDPVTGGRYGGSGHLLWLGERTRDPDGAHARLLAGLSNAVACKLGPDAAVRDVLRLCELLDPDRLPGRLSLISRMGADAIRAALPPLVRAVRDAGHPVVWLCDPMHGNTVAATGGGKTRSLRAVIDEAVAFVAVHRDEGTWPGGLHLELTGDDVHECVDDATERPPAGRATSLCDPRLNAQQALTVAGAISDVLGRTAAGPSAAVRGDAPVSDAA